MSNTNTNNGMKGLLRANGLMVVQKKKVDMQDGSYFYNLGLSNFTDMIICTAGKVADELETGKKYNFGFDFLDKKLKIVSFEVSA